MNSENGSVVLSNFNDFGNFTFWEYIVSGDFEGVWFLLAMPGIMIVGTSIVALFYVLMKRSRVKTEKVSSIITVANGDSDTTFYINHRKSTSQQ